MSENSFGFEIKPLPLWLRYPNFLAEKLGINAPCLTPENICRAASRNVSLPSNVPPYVENALEILCRSLRDDTNLHWFGRMNYWNVIVTGLSSLLEVEHMFQCDPSLIKTKLIDPVLVVGLPRSGTTFLHRLLSSLEPAQGIELYRYMYPIQKHPDTRQISTFAIFEPWRIASSIYNMDAIHYMRPHLPDECNFGLRMSLHSMLFWSIAPTYSYLLWLLDQDFQETYKFYRKLIILYQQQLPGKRLTLKCPYHVAWLPSLVDVFPEAHIVETHRDPLDTIASDCKLTLALHGLSTNCLDWEKVVSYVYSKTYCFAQRSIAFSNSDTGKQIFHTKYTSLLKDTEIVIRKAYDFWGISFTKNNAETLKQHLINNRQHKYGRNSYSLEQFGLSSNKIIQDFKEYREKFVVNSPV